MGRETRGSAIAGLALVLLSGWLARDAEAHPANMSWVAQQFRLRVGRDAIQVELFVRYYEFPSMTQRRRMDTDGDGAIADNELWAYGQTIDRELADQLVLVVDGERVSLRADYPPVLDLMDEWRVVPCHHEQRSVFAAPLRLEPGQRVDVSFATKAFPDNPGFFRYAVVGEGVRVLELSIGPQPEVDLDDALPPDPEVREIELACELVEETDEAPAAPPPAAGPPEEPGREARPDTFMVGLRVFQKRVTAYFKGEFQVWAFLALLAAAFVYGGLHALAPGHAKTITAAYLIGAHATPWHAVLLGMVVTVSHTWSIYMLALVTHLCYGGEVRPETHGLVMAGSGALIVLLGIGQFVSRLRGRGFLGHHHGPGGHTHVHPHAPHDPHHNGDEHAHPHGHADHDPAHDHPHEHPAGHTHSHAPRAGAGEDGITVKSLVLLGFSGGIVPCPGALWIYFLSLSLHRTLEGIVLITALGAGLATVLTALGLVTVRVRRGLLAGEARGRGGRLRRAGAWLGRWIGLIAPCLIAVMGLVLVLWGLLSAGVL